MGAAVSGIGPDATAYCDRSANFLVVALGSNNARLVDEVGDEPGQVLLGSRSSSDYAPQLLPAGLAKP
jgi:hypothetical protein